MVTVLPTVLVAWAARHDGAGALRAELTDRAIDEVDTVEEVDYMHGDPIIETLPLGQLNHLAQVQARLQRRLGLLVQLKPLCARLKALPRPECLIFAEDLPKAEVHLVVFFIQSKTTGML